MRNMEMSQAAALAADWHSGQFSPLYRFSCMAKRHKGIENMPISLLECCLTDIRRCIDAVVKSKYPNYKRDLQSLCLLRQYFNELILQKTAEFDSLLLVNDLDQVRYDHAA